MNKAGVAPVLVIGWGNSSRGDDALGPLFVEQLSADLDDEQVEWLTDFQLQVEHALDLAGRQRVLFVDADIRCAAPFTVTQVLPTRDASFTTHALSPAAVLQVMRDIDGGEPPPCTLLAIRAERCELGEPLGSAAREHLARALVWARDWLTAELDHA